MKMKKSIALCFWVFTFFGGNVYSQVTIASEDFENNLTLFTATTGSPNFFTGNSAAGDRPANSPFSFSNNYSCGMANGTLTLTSNSIDVSTYSSIFLNFKLAAFSIGDINNGMELFDPVTISVSPDDGLNYYPTVEVDGYQDSYWSFTGGTAIATTAFDGNQFVAWFTPSGSGERTTDGYSTIRITNLPQTPKLRIRITISTNAAPELWLIDNFEIKGTPVTTQLVNVYPFSLNGFTAVTGNTSAEQTYTVRGLNLTDNISINAPVGFEISQTSGGVFGSTITLNQSGGSVPWTPIYVRMNSTILGANSGNISHASSGAITKNEGLSGNVLAAEPTVPSTVNFTNITSSSMRINFTGGNGQGRIVVMKLFSPISSAPVDGVDYTASAFGMYGSTLAPGEYVIYNGTATSLDVSWLRSASNYHVAVFEYNSGGINSARNYLSAAGTGNATTLVVNGGLELTSANTLYTIDFDNTVPRVNNGAFAGVSVVPSPVAGQLNSSSWNIGPIPFSQSLDQAQFGISNNSGGGVTTGNVSPSAPGFYAFEISPGNRSLGVQMTYPGITQNTSNIANTLRIQNNTGTMITTLALSYKVYHLNNTSDAVYYGLDYSYNNFDYINVTADTSELGVIPPTVWTVELKSYVLTNLSIGNGSTFYLRWFGEMYFNSPETDEIAWDDINIVANPTTVFPRIAGNFQNMEVLGPVQLSGNSTVAHDVIMGQNIELGDYNLTVGGNISGSSSGYIKTNGAGAVTLNNITTARNFPIGNSTYNPLTISNGSGLNWTAKVDDGINNVVPPYSTDKAVLRTWTITPSTNPPPSGANLTFSYNDGDVTQLGSNFSTGENVQVWHKENAGWSTASGALSPTGVPGNTRTVSLNNWAKYSSFAIANLSGPLPIVFGLVKAKQEPGGVKVSWENLTEENISSYQIERSADGGTFTSIGQVNPYLNNGSKALYDWLDASPYGNDNFYRIAARENSGKIVYSTIVRIKHGNSKPAILVYPNPVTDQKQFYLQFSGIPKGVYEITVFTMGGHQVYKSSLLHEGGSVSMPFNGGETLKPGVYVLWLRNGNMQIQTKFVYR